MYYPDSVIDEIRTKNDIVDVISGYMQLRKKGSSHFGLCPFHNERSASFSVNQQRQMYHCFGCGKSGDVISFVMEYENYTFREALKLLADRAGEILPEADPSGEESAQDKLKARVLEVYKEAARYYHDQLRAILMAYCFLMISILMIIQRMAGLMNMICGMKSTFK